MPITIPITVSKSGLVLGLFVLPLSLDFRSSDQGGGMWQYALVVVTLLGAALLFLNRYWPKASGTLWRLCSLAVLVTIGGSVVSFALNDAPADRYLRVMLPIGLFAAAFYISTAMMLSGGEVMLDQLMFRGLAASTVFSVVAGVTVSGVNLGEIRYQILSPVMLLFMAVLLHNLLVVRTRRRTSMLLLLFCIALQLLSVTRSSVLGALVVGLAAVWLASPNILRFGGRVMRYAVIAAVVAFLALQAVGLLVPQVGERWAARLSAREIYGVDPTTLSRIAEIKEQLDVWSSTPKTTLIGKGYGASYGWSKDLFDQLLDTGAFDLFGLDQQYFEFGHNFWTSSLFAGGLLFGLALPAALICATWQGLRLSRRLQRHWRHRAETHYVTRSTLMLVAVLAITIGGNPFGSRYTGLMAGLSLGMLVAARRSIAVGLPQPTAVPTPLRSRTWR